MRDCAPLIVPVVKGNIFSQNQCPQNTLEKEKMINIPYTSAMNSVIWIQVCTRHDIGFAIRMLNRY